jgi:carboxypeptidase T
LQTIGKSLEGRDIVAVRIANDPEFNIDEPSVLFNALHHAREVMTVEIIEDILVSLTRDYNTDDKVRAWVDGLQIWLIPMINPDGSNKVWTSDAMWRKNTRNNVGVDINRNYPYKWGECNGSSSSTWAQDYRGPSAGSEPETQTMMSFIEKTKPVYNISYHAYGEMVIHPFGCDGSLPNPVDQVVETAKVLGGLVKHVVGASWQILYDVDGGDIDWMYGVHHVIPFVLEVSSRSDGFQPSYSRRDPVVNQNRIGWKYLLAKASGIGLPQNPNRNPQQQPTTIRWGRSWFESEMLKFKKMKKSILVSKDYLRVRVQNSSGRTLLEHVLVPTKETQHYMLSKGNYRIQVISPRGQVLNQKQFSVDSHLDNAVVVE